MSGNAERERKFLIKKTPVLAKIPREKIQQGYIASTPDKVEVRIRKKGRKHTITIKKGEGSARFEREIPISGKDFQRLKLLIQGKMIHKTRYVIPYRKHQIELDIYDGKLQGLKTAEVEFKNEKDQRTFSPPDWFDREITGSSSYSNRKLAVSGLSKRLRQRKVKS